MKPGLICWWMMSGASDIWCYKSSSRPAARYVSSCVRNLKNVAMSLHLNDCKPNPINRKYWMVSWSCIKWVVLDLRFQCSFPILADSKNYKITMRLIILGIMYTRYFPQHKKSPWSDHTSTPRWYIVEYVDLAAKMKVHWVVTDTLSVYFRW